MPTPPTETFSLTYLALHLLTFGNYLHQFGAGYNANPPTQAKLDRSPLKSFVLCLLGEELASQTERGGDVVSHK